MLYDVVAITWTEDYLKMTSYFETRTIEATKLGEREAHNRAEELVEMWASLEHNPKRFINGRDHGAYVEDWLKGIARGIRVSVLNHRAEGL